MDTQAHDIRLAAALEISNPAGPLRTLNRSQAEDLAAALAADLARTLPGADEVMLVLAGALFEPAQLLRPGLPAWSALLDLARPSLREQGVQPQLLAIGTHQGRMPDQRLAPPSRPAPSQFLVIPLMLISTAEHGPGLEAALERDLFERGSIDPPARALLHQALGLDSVHGQLLTATDLLALQHVQMDAAGLGAFWPVVEHAVLAPEEDQQFELAAGLTAAWQADKAGLVIDFVTFDSFQRPPGEYVLWQRAFRTLTALMETHGLEWQVDCGPDVRLEAAGRLAIHSAGSWPGPDSVTEHTDPDAGLIAWTVAAGGALAHWYPLDGGTARARRELLEQRHGSIERPGGVQFCPQTLRLLPGTDP